MKRYRYIVINKDNMKQLSHHKDADSVRLLLYGKDVGHFIVVKDERTVINWENLERDDDPLTQTHKIKNLLEIS